MTELEKQIIEMYIQKGGSINNIHKRLNISTYYVNAVLTKYNIPKKSQSQVVRETQYPETCDFNEDFFEIIDTPAKAYWLGWILTDGSVSTTTLTFVLHSQDSEILDLFCKDLKIGRKPTIRNNRVSLSINSKKMINDLYELGIYPNKSNTVTPFDVPEELENHYLRGMFDGDGGITVCTPRKLGRTPDKEFSFCGSFDTVNYFYKILKKNVPEINEKTLSLNGKSKVNYRVRWSGTNQINRIGQWLYLEDNGYCLKRKKEKILIS